MVSRWLILPFAAAAASTEHDVRFRYSVSDGRSALQHFRENAIRENKVSTAPLLGRGLRSEAAIGEAVAAAAGHARRLCGGPAPAWALHSEALDADGVQHVVLSRADGGRWQYLALGGRELLAAEPPLCRRPGPARRLHTHFVEDFGFLHERMKTPELFEAGDALTLLHPHGDTILQDCIGAFHKTAKDRCHRDFKVSVQTATLAIMDGFRVRITADISDEKENKTATHNIDCFFEEPATAALEKDVEKGDVLPHEPGMTYTIGMGMDVCNATKDKEHPLVDLFEMHSLGELSLYRGYRHVYDDVPRLFGGSAATARRLAELPADWDLRQEHHKCFPGMHGGESTVQNQGRCGSCWAFGSASAMMINLCIASGGDESTKHSEWKRYEVAVQHIMTCNKEHMGCDGGHAMAAKEAFVSSGIAKTADVPYMCGRGDALRHFEVEGRTCGAYPWGGDASQCTKVTNNWHLEGLYSVSGEHEMMMALHDGYALFVTVEVPREFMRFRGNAVFMPSPDPEIIGGHALVCVGYGELDGQKYWWVQNSWGPNWGDRGFVKMARGANYLGFEDTALVFRGYSEGKEEGMPPRVGLEVGAFAIPTSPEQILPTLQALSQQQRLALAAALVAAAALLVCACGCCSSSPGYQVVQE